MIDLQKSFAPHPPLNGRYKAFVGNYIGDETSAPWIARPICVVPAVACNFVINESTQ